MLIKRFRNLRQSYKLLLSFGVLVMIMMFLFMIMYGIMLDKMESMAIASNEVAHRQVQSRLEQRFDEFQRISSDFQNYADLVWLFNGERKFDGETINRVSRLKEDLPNISLSNQDIIGYYVYSPANDFLLSNSHASLRIDLYYDELYAIDGMDYDAWYAMMHDKAGKALFLPAQSVNWDGVRAESLFCVYPIYANSSLSVTGRVVFMLRESTVMGFFSEGLDGRTSYACVMNEGGTVVAQLGDEELFAQIGDPVNMPDGTRSAIIDGRDVIVLKSTSNMGFSCLSIIERKAVSAELSDVQMLVFGGLAVLLFVSILLSLLLTHQNTRQLRSMLATLDGMGYRFENENELQQLNDLILFQHSTNEDYQRELLRKRQWTQSIMFERLLDNRQVDSLMLTELESRLPCERVMCVFLDLYSEDDQTDVYLVQQRLAKNLDTAGECVPYYRVVSETRIQLVYRDMTDTSISAFFRRLTELSASEGVRIKCFIGPAVESYTNLPVSVRNAQREIMLHDTADGNEVILCSQTPEADIDGIYTLETERQLMQYCLQGEREGASALLNSIVYSVNQNGVASQLTTQMLIAGLCNTMLKILNTLPGKLDNETEAWMMNGALDVMRTQSLGALFDFVHRCILVFAEYTGRVKSENLVRRIEEINEYIHENYADPDLRLTLIAEHFDLTERYLSEFYKKNTGVNLSVYIEGVRMKKAQELLKDRLPVGEVAARVGYMNVNTFRRAYRRQFGVNPSDEMK